METKTLQVFFVEDDPLMVRMYERIFKLNNMTVVMAFNGEEAITKLPTLTPVPDIIVLDAMMPKMNGFQVLEYIKKEEHLKNIPVIMLSNLAGKEDVDRALGMGANAYLIKSEFEPKDVIEKIKAFVVHE